MYFLLVFLLLFFGCNAREQYPWSGTDEIDEDVDLLLKQGLKIGYLPKTSINGENSVYCAIILGHLEINRLANEGDKLLGWSSSAEISSVMKKIIYE